MTGRTSATVPWRTGWLVLALIAFATTSTAKSNLLFVVDASNSMWGQVDGTAKMTTAKGALGRLLADVPTGTEVALLAYGHRREADCADVELVAPFGSGSTAALRTAVEALSPKGKTPIAAALEAAGEAFAGREEDSNGIVLISDGIETCDGDPCAVAARLVASGIDLRVHVIGFDVDDAAREQLQCIAKAGHGEYHDAGSAEDFEIAVREAHAAAVAVAPEPTSRELFRDDFDGDELGEAWHVVAPDRDGFLVEDGHLLTVSGDAGLPGSGATSNLFRLSGVELPDGDWTASVVLDMPLQTAKETLLFGLYEAEDSFLVAELQGGGNKHYGWWLNLRLRKRSGGTDTKADRRLAALSCNVCGAGRRYPDFARQVAGPVEIRLVKEGRSFHAEAKLSGPDAQWMETDALTLLRARGDLALLLTQSDDTKGETYASVDRVVIEVTE